MKKRILPVMLCLLVGLALLLVSCSLNVTPRTTTPPATAALPTTQATTGSTAAPSAPPAATTGSTATVTTAAPAGTTAVPATAAPATTAAAPTPMPPTTLAPTTAAALPGPGGIRRTTPVPEAAAKPFQANTSGYTYQFAFVRVNLLGNLELDEALYFSAEEIAEARKHGVEWMIEEGGYAIVNDSFDWHKAEYHDEIKPADLSFSVLHLFRQKSRNKVALRQDCDKQTFIEEVNSREAIHGWLALRDGKVCGVYEVPSPSDIEVETEEPYEPGDPYVYQAIVTAANDESGVDVLIDDIVIIGVEETELLEAYGIDPADVEGDYVLINEMEEFDGYSLTLDASLEVAEVDENEYIEYVTYSYYDFMTYLTDVATDGILANIVDSGELGISMIREIYLPAP